MKDNAKKWTKPPLTPMEPSMDDPVHVEGIGTMNRSQAEKHYPGINHTPTNLYKNRLTNSIAKVIGEAVEPDNITMSVPLFIRCLEWAKEDAKNDVELHQMTERALMMGKLLTTDDYEKLIK